MAQAVVVFFDDEADAAVRAVRHKLDRAGVPAESRFAPHVTLAMASAIPDRTRAALRADLRLLAVPAIWLAALSTFSSSENVLMLAAVADPELLAVHSAVHDVLAGKVRNPSAYYLPGSWMPHCALASGVTDEQVVAGFGAVFPVESIHARVREISIADSVTGEIDVLVTKP